MKEKIEKLIKEIGIKEVEAILNQIKSKVNVQQKLKMDFVKLLTGCTISFVCDDIEYQKDRKLLFFYQKNKNIFWVKYDIWSNFKSKYNLNDQELKDLLVGIVEEELNYKGVTPENAFLYPNSTVEEVLNYKELATNNKKTMKDYKNYFKYPY
jgi:hypothetical protein